MLVCVRNFVHYTKICTLLLNVRRNIVLYHKEKQHIVNLNHQIIF